MFVSIPYRQDGVHPIWGAPTARANFCEEDYVVSNTIAEFVNTLTNLAYLGYAAIRLSRAPTKHAPFAVKMPYYGLALVGVCSAVFHGSLNYYAQMGDDLSMLVASACVLHRTTTFERSLAETKSFTKFLVLGLTVIVIYHVVTDEKIVHELTFVLLILIVGLQTRSIISRRVNNDRKRAVLRRDTYLGVGCFILGYIFWQLDFRYCAQLTEHKRQFGMPWGFALEFHGYWHLLTAIGAFKFMVLVEELTQSATEARYSKAN